MARSLGSRTSQVTNLQVPQPQVGTTGVIGLLPLVASVVLLLAGLGLLYASTLPLSFFQSTVLSLGLGPFASYLTPALRATLVVRLRIVAGALLLAGATVFAVRVRIREAIGWFSAALTASWRTLADDGRRAVVNEPKPYLWALAATTAFGALVRLRFLFQPMRLDEAYSFLFFASKPLFFGLSVYHNGGNNHLFHTLLMHIAYFIFGGSPWAVRLPAYIGGVLMIPAAYAAVRASNAPAAAIFTAALIAGSSIVIEYSTNARGYTIMCLCFLTTIAAARYAAAGGNLAAWVVFVIASALGFYALPLMLYPFGTVLAWVVLVRPAVWRDAVVAAAATASIVLLLYLPVIAVSGWATILSNKYVAAHAWPEFIALTRGLLASAWKLWNRDMPLAVETILVGGFFAAPFVLFRRERSTLLLAIAAAGFCTAAMAVQRALIGERVWLFLLPVYFEVAVAGVGGLFALLRRTRVWPAWSAAVAAALCLWLTARVARSPAIAESTETGVLRSANEITAILRPRLTERDAVLAGPISKIVLQYYFRSSGLPDTLLYPELVGSGRRFIVVNHLYGDTLESVLAEFGSSAAAVGESRVVGRFAHADVYEVSLR